MSVITKTASHRRILMVSLEQDIDVPGLTLLESQLMFGVQQLMHLYTRFALCDFDVPADSLVIKRILSYQSLVGELIQLGARHQCRYIMYGSMKARTVDTMLNSIDVTIKVFDVVQETHVVDSHYSFCVFEGINPQTTHFTPQWEEFQSLVLWVSSLLVLSLEPTQTSFWFKSQSQSQAKYPSLISLAHTAPEFDAIYQAFKLNSDVEKIEPLTQITLASPDLFLPHLELAMIYKRLGQYHQSIEKFNVAWSLLDGIHPWQKADLATHHGICHALIEDKEQAIAWWKKAIEIEPRLVTPYINLALCMEEAENLDEAKFYYEKARQYAPADHRIYVNLARLYSKTHDWDSAISQYRQLVRLEPNDPWYHSDLANCCLQKGDLKEALNHLKMTAQLDPSGEAGRCAQIILEGLQAVEA